MAESIAGVRAGADATGSAAQNVTEAAGVLNLETKELRGRIDTYLEQMRAA